MPKGETSRPLNSTERKAAKTLLNIQKGMEGKSTANRMEIIMGSRFGKAAAILANAKNKETVRKRMKDVGRNQGASKANQDVRRAAKGVYNVFNPKK